MSTAGANGQQILTDDELAELELRFTGLLGVPPGDASGWVDFSLRVSDTASLVRPRAALLLADREGAPVARMVVRSADEYDSSGPGRLVMGAATSIKPPEGGVARSRRATGPAASHVAVVAAFSAQPNEAQVAQLQEASMAGPVRAVAVVDVGTPARTIVRLLDGIDATSSTIGAPAAELVVLPRVTDSDARTHLRRTVLTRYAGTADLRDFGEGDGPARTSDGVVVLLTGLSGSGKSTIARELAEHLLQASSREVTLLDGDEVRTLLSSDLGFSSADRATNLRRIAWVAALVARHGGVAICAPIAPYADIRAEMRAMIEPYGRLVLVYVSTPLHVCEQRDRKGLYARARAGLIPGFTGIDDPYEIPTDADLVIDTSITQLDEAVHRIAQSI